MERASGSPSQEVQRHFDGVVYAPSSCVSEFTSPQKVYTFSLIRDCILPKSLKCSHPATELTWDPQSDMPHVAQLGASLDLII